MARPLLSLTIDHKPVSVNRYWLRRRGGGVYLSDEAHALRQAVEVAFSATQRPKLAGGLTVRIDAFWGRLGADADNVCKATLDALTHAGAWEDDGQVCRVWADRYLDRGQPRLEVTVTRTRSRALLAALPARFR